MRKAGKRRALIVGGFCQAVLEELGFSPVPTGISVGASGRPMTPGFAPPPTASAISVFLGSVWIPLAMEKLILPELGHLVREVRPERRMSDLV